jgi:hypothetical protein
MDLSVLERNTGQTVELLSRIYELIKQGGVGDAKAGVTTEAVAAKVEETKAAEPRRVSYEPPKPGVDLALTRYGT